MPIMSETQKDALAEVINIAFSCAGAALSELTGRRVLLDVPRINIHPIDELQLALSDLVESPREKEAHALEIQEGQPKGAS